MAYLIDTNKLAAIPAGARKLTGLTYDEVEMLDEQKANLVERNGGFADWLIEVRKGIFTYLRIHNESYPFSKKSA